MTEPHIRRSGPSDSEGGSACGPRPMHISLRGGERIFLNGAVIRVDRKVTLELMNDATFLLENHVLQVEDTTTPLRQLYFAVQAMLMDPQNAGASRRLFEAMARDLKSALSSERLLVGVDEAMAQVAGGRPFHALKTLRALFPEEAERLGAAAERPRRAASLAGRPASLGTDDEEVQGPSAADPDRPPEAAHAGRAAEAPQSLQ